VFYERTLVSPLGVVGCRADRGGLCGKRLLRALGFGCARRGVVGVSLARGEIRASESHHRPSSVGRAGAFAVPSLLAEELQRFSASRVRCRDGARRESRVSVLGYLVDPASSHMLVSKIKPCMSKYKRLYCETANGSLNQLWFI
jgi:hypothetical protein